MRFDSVRSALEPSGGLGGQIMLELRKMWDTRPGLLLMVVSMFSGPVTAVLVGCVGTVDDLGEIIAWAVCGPLVLLPLVGLRSTASEWEHRGVQHTFAQNPRRAEVLAAKLCAVSLATTATWFVTMLSALVVSATCKASMDSGSDVLMLSILLALQLAALFGAAIGAATMSVKWSLLAVAITALLMLPSITSWLGSLAIWLVMPLQVHHLVNGIWLALPCFLTTIALWLALPLAIGTWRWLRRDILN